MKLKKFWSMGGARAGCAPLNPPLPWGTPIVKWDGDLGWEYPRSRSGPRSGQGVTPNQDSIGCACYAADSMPLAFMQEDFLVLFAFKRI